MNKKQAYCGRRGNKNIKRELKFGEGGSSDRKLWRAARRARLKQVKEKWDSQMAMAKEEKISLWGRIKKFFSNLYKRILRKDE